MTTPTPTLQAAREALPAKWESHYSGEYPDVRYSLTNIILNTRRALDTYRAGDGGKT